MPSNPHLKRAVQRLFFALWPDPGLEKDLWRLGQRMQQAFDGRVVKAENIHLTLAFLGSVPVERVDDLRAIGESISVDRFRLDLNQTGCWKRSAVGWVAPAHVPAPLEALVSELCRRLLEVGFPVDARPFAPHVTLLRKAKCNKLAAHPNVQLVWRIDRFLLMQSETRQTGPIYTQVGAWGLD
ncbi:MAG: RNA 2',3'-cyclic phosphodiesterase [Gammaproteobacteria bacterium]|nr:RNA 2',3'-cyclic phosphodiesterase [Gammaproteobacteria bacterium]MDH3468224.1 RNA 2',3'-cyclic phosphodiesterase [Gammaproteobacteria bacterium]